MPSKKVLRQLFDYRDGNLYTKKASHGRRKGVAIGGRLGRYLYAGIGYKQYAVHRLVWVWHNGPIAKGLQVDHLDHNPLNNRIENLRLATNAENGRNRPVSKNSPTGVHGVRFRDGKWHASIALGAFDTFEEAVAMRKAAEKLAGYHPNHGQSKAAPFGAALSV